jgi:nitrous-oxide reductase
MVMHPRTRALVAAAAAVLVSLAACDGKKTGASAGLSPAEQVYVPVGKYDKYYAFLSGGQAGSVLIYGLPSGRLLRSVPVFEPRAQYGYGIPGTDTYERLKATGPLWGDTHHPVLSETHGDYDGRYLWINDKANARVARIDLTHFETAAIARIPNIEAAHGIAVVSPDTSYIMVNGEFRHELTGTLPDPDAYQSVVAFIDPITLASRFQVLLPGNADINDTSKDGRWGFTTMYNLEKGLTIEDMIRRDEDAIGAIDIHAAEKAIAAGEFQTVNGVKVIDPDKTKEKVLYLIPVPKNPHGCDVTPDGKYVMGSGKLSPTVTVIDISKIDKVKNTRDAIAGQPEVGMGPLHTTFDGRGNAYTSLFIDSQIVKWNIAKAVAGEPDYVVDRVDIHYNVGHTQATLAETMHPTGEYLLSLNKLSKDMYLPVGPAMPENQELIDISGEKMKLISAFPSEPEPHDAVFMRAEDLAPKVLQVDKPPPNAVTEEKSRVERVGPHDVHVFMTVVRSKFGLNDFTVNQGDKVTLTVSNIETIRDMTHGFALDGYGINLAIDPGQTKDVTFVADQPGTHWYYCTWFCSALHLEMRGRMLVEPPDAEKMRSEKKEKEEKQHHEEDVWG